MRRWRGLLVLVLLLTTLGAVPGQAAEAGCDPDAENPGGDWHYFGGDLWSSRNQWQEDTIGPDNVGSLEPVWSFNNGPGTGYIDTAVVAGDCVYFHDAPQFGAAWIYAVNIDTGALVWEQDALPDVPPGTSGGWGSRTSPVVVDGRVHLNVTTPDGPDGQAAIATAFDARTGERLWTSEPISFGYTARNMSSPGVWDGLHFIGTIGPDLDNNAREGYAILDAATGETLLARKTVPEEDYEIGYVGGGMWTSPAINPETGYLYITTNNPNQGDRQHDYGNAFLKIDLARQRNGQPNPDFGDVVDSFMGDPDNYLYPMGYNNPTCQYVAPHLREIHPFFNSGWGPHTGCGHVDVDFGSSPTLVRHPSGRLLVAASQKSGTFHTGDADRMTVVWTRTMTYPNAYQGHSSSAANDGERVFTVANPGILFAYDALTGEELWSSPVISDAGLSHHPVTFANGVVYVVSNTGHLHGFDADTGELLLRRALRDDSGVDCPAYANPEQWFLFGPFSWSAGVTVANNTVIATCDAGPDAEGSAVVAYRLP